MTRKAAEQHCSHMGVPAIGLAARLGVGWSMVRPVRAFYFSVPPHERNKITLRTKTRAIQLNVTNDQREKLTLRP